mmetsp:Transcript_4254/g.8185  ORF Transcript_4254/g.8185 Transcript_4254/m.8185 type:complete len:202 (+) Transcript_4254:442-1047(+)
MQALCHQQVPPLGLGVLKRAEVGEGDVAHVHHRAERVGDGRVRAVEVLQHPRCRHIELRLQHRAPHHRRVHHGHAKASLPSRGDRGVSVDIPRALLGQRLPQGVEAVVFAHGLDVAPVLLGPHAFGVHRGVVVHVHGGGGGGDDDGLHRRLGRAGLQDVVGALEGRVNDVFDCGALEEDRAGRVEHAACACDGLRERSLLQ